MFSVHHVPSDVSQRWNGDILNSLSIKDVVIKSLNLFSRDCMSSVGVLML